MWSCLSDKHALRLSEGALRGISGWFFGAAPMCCSGLYMSGSRASVYGMRASGLCRAHYGQDATILYMYVPFGGFLLRVLSRTKLATNHTLP